MCLLNKVAIITGASSGIGAATAALFSHKGSALILSGRNESGLDRTIENCHPDSRDRIIKVVGDLTVEHNVENVVSEAIKKFGRLNVLVNCAGIMKFSSIENITLAAYDETMNANARSVVHLTHLCVPHLIKTKGTIVNVSSICASRTFPNLLAYGMSKAAIDQFTKSIALELASKGVRANSVNPGVIKTQLQKHGGQFNDEQYKDFIEHAKLTHPLGRPGEVEEVAKLIEFLASDASSFITAENIHVDGGKHVVCPR